MMPLSARLLWTLLWTTSFSTELQLVLECVAFDSTVGLGWIGVAEAVFIMIFGIARPFALPFCIFCIRALKSLLDKTIVLGFVDGGDEFVRPGGFGQILMGARTLWIWTGVKGTVLTGMRVP